MTATVNEAPYANLGPEQVLAAVEATGYRCDGRLLALNSYENRVYQIGIEDESPLVGKFYRPERWSDAAILEEHAFAQELAEREIPVVAPLATDGRTLHEFEGYRFALYPRRGGRWPELQEADDRLWVGRFLGRIHAVGSVRAFEHRPVLSVASMAEEPVAYLLQHNVIPAELRVPYTSLLDDLLVRIRASFERAGECAQIRLHGDCHLGNILWTDAGPHFVDLDDCRMGPAIQDLWMLLSGDRMEQALQLSDIVEGYEEFYEFNRRELHLVEALRTLRIINYAAWLARRWDDPAFPQAFPWFDSPRFWEEHILSLREQAALLDEPPLQI
ncbi:stress response serine/threonine protein kinase YihE [Alkalilimnicola ehrlichii]|uniref:Stress response kinase A n=1 Tax=Alkalilimnicola ehrlichii TaxID=351052 RepID=A0A3E0WIT3_9GAMM|nr:serine/threonine protein kinase [Alkalilimnicola ehrlichii]RFA26146.1 stress response serine/threonine protein kinase YihE [Alkalilimnicola ehrlichii]RFA32359.1 stress response serine/threonine protein kinase YihE [Alkalilimnicola ehrlichii]